MPQGQREKQPKTSACYFLIGTLAPDTTQPWTDARTVIWRILLVSAALEVPFLQETWHEPARTNIRKKAVVAFVIKLYSWQLSADAWPLGPHVAFGEKDVIQLTVSKWKDKGNVYICDGETLQPTQILDVLLVCYVPDCHVNQHPPPTNGLIWPPTPPMAAATSLMPNRPALGLLSEGEGAHAWIPQSNLNM